MWFDIISDEIIDVEQLKKEFEQIEFEGDFVDYIASRKVENGGTLEDFLPF